MEYESAIQEIKSGLDMYIRFAEKLGVRMVHRHVGDVGLELELIDGHMNSWQMAHGGVIMSMFDIVMGMSAKTLDEASSGATTVEKTNFLKAATGGVTGARSPSGLDVHWFLSKANCAMNSKTCLPVPRARLNFVTLAKKATDHVTRSTGAGGTRYRQDSQFTRSMGTHAG